MLSRPDYLIGEITGPITGEAGLRERAALTKVRDMLWNDDILEELFNMRTTVIKRKCGTAACIGGHVGLVMGLDMCSTHQYVRAFHSKIYHGLGDLYYNNDAVDYHATKSQAIQAIDNYLATGNARWVKVLRL